MAKGAKRYLTSSRARFLYGDPSEMPWGQIEKTAQKTFSEVERFEIHACTNAYSRELSWYEDGVSIEDVETLRNDIVKRAQDLSEILQRCDSISAIRGQTADHQALNALTVMFGSDGFNLREEIGYAARSAQRLIAGLTSNITSKPETTSRISEVMGLAAFIAGALDGIQLDKVRKARGSTIWTDAKEYQRWGIPIGPKSKRFQNFAGAVLKREISESQLAFAFKEGWWRAIGQYEDAYDRAMGKGK